MSEETIKDLLEKYKEGKTSLKEEKFLHENEGFGAWSSFVKKSKIETPNNQNEKLWESFEEKTQKKSRFKIGFISSVAASILLILSIYLGNEYQYNQEELRKEALLEEAKSMFFSETEPIEMNRILFEDETLIVYTKTE